MQGLRSTIVVKYFKSFFYQVGHLTDISCVLFLRSIVGTAFLLQAESVIITVSLALVVFVRFFLELGQNAPAHMLDI